MSKNKNIYHRVKETCGYIWNWLQLCTLSFDNVRFINQAWSTLSCFCIQDWVSMIDSNRTACGQCPLWVPEVKPPEAFTVWCLNLLKQLVYGKFLGLMSPYIQIVFYLSFYWLFSSTTATLGPLSRGHCHSPNLNHCNLSRTTGAS